MLFVFVLIRKISSEILIITLFFFQGCIGTVVNQGPVEMATTFLGHEKNKPLKSLIPDKNKSSTTLNSTTYEDIQNRLRITFQQFLIK